MKNFYKKSEKLLLAFLKEPGGFSFFPSSIFWEKKDFDLKKKYKIFFNSENYLKKSENSKNLLYIHIPFCPRICSYCNCFKYQLRTRKEIQKYLIFLEKEAEILYKMNNFSKIKIDGIFIGGGTPNILKIKEFEILFKIIKKYFKISEVDDFLIDGHPNFYNEEKILFLKKSGIKRITFAIQSFDKEVLQKNNRDFYDLEKVKKQIFYSKKIGLKINIDFLIGLIGQTKGTILQDFEILKDINYDNLSVHYFMESNNIFYKNNEKFLELVNFTKKYLEKNIQNYFDSNIFEDYFVSKKTTTLTLGSSCITNIFGKIIYSKPNLKKYFEYLEKGDIPIQKGFELGEREEMVKYIYLNILSGINIKNFYNLFHKNIFKEFLFEFKFLSLNNVIKIENGKIISLFSDRETLIYFNIFIMKNFKNIIFPEIDLSEMDKFFSENGELIDK